MLAATLFCACVLIYIYWNYKYDKKCYELPPSIREPWPIALSSARIMLKNKDTWEKFKYFFNESLETGGLCYFYIGFRRIYAVTDPDDCATVLALPDKSHMYNMLRPWLGDGMLTAPAPLAKLHRKLLGTIQSIHNYDKAIKRFNTQAVSLVLGISSHGGGEAFDVHPHLSQYTLEAFSYNIMGLKQTDCFDFNQYTETVQNVLQVVRERLENIFYHSDTIYSMSRLKREESEKIEIVNSTAKLMIQQCKSMLYTNIDGTRKEKAPAERLLSDVLFELLEKGIFTDKLLLDEVTSAIFAGSDTTAFTLLYTVLLLGSHPEEQERTVEEFQQVLNGREEVGRDDFPKLVYLEAVLKESMRLYPYVPVLGRYLEKDLKLKHYTLPAGCECFVSVYGSHRHSRWGEDATQFIPARWLAGGAAATTHVPQLFTFSAGPRVCMGKKYAMMSMKIVLVHLLRAYRFRADVSKLQLQYNLVIVPKDGQLITIEKRN